MVMDRSTYVPCNLSKKTSDLDVTLLNDGLTINLPCEQATHGQNNILVLLWMPM